MPFKANAARRHHIPKQRHRVTNWAEYDAALRARGSLTVWFTPEAIEGHRSLIAGWSVKPSVQRLSGDECPCRVMVLSAVGVSRRMMVSEAPAS
jgi:hypothetical protein